MITKEAIEAAKAAYWHEVHNGGGYSDKCYEAAIEAALPFLPIAVEGKVKPLEWSDEGFGEYIARSVIGWFYIGRPASSWNLTTPQGVVSSHETLDEAKAAAQSDYGVAILSALISSPVSVPEGWQLVPVQPTVEMNNVGQKWIAQAVKEGQPAHWQAFYPTDIYKAMLATAPAPPSSPGKDGGQEVEAVAKLVYEAMRIAAHECDPDREKPQWVEGGNSLMQDQARRIARSISDAHPASTALVERLTKALDGLNVQYGAPDGISINEATRAAAKGIIRFALSANEDAELLHGMGSDAEFLRDLADRLRSIPVMHGTTGFDIDVLHDMARRLSPAALSSSSTSREGER